MTASGSNFMNATGAAAITAVPDLTCLVDWPDITIGGNSTFTDNGFDIFNGNKHWGPSGSGVDCGEAIDASGSSGLSPLSISSHPHICAAFSEPNPVFPFLPIPQPEFDETFTSWDVEGVFDDGSCPDPNPLLIPYQIVFWRDITAD